RGLFARQAALPGWSPPPRRRGRPVSQQKESSMKRTALLAVVAFLLAAGSASAAPQAIRGVVVAKRVHNGTIVLATGSKGLAVTVRTSPRSVRLGQRVSVTGTRLRNGVLRASQLRVLSRVKTTRIRGMVVKRLAHTMR